MGEKTTFVNEYFRETVGQRKTDFCIQQMNDGRIATLHVTAGGMTPIGYLTNMSRRSVMNKQNVECFAARGNLPRGADTKFLAVLEEIHDYYAILNFTGYPVSFADYRLAASLVALQWDGSGTIELLGGQEFALTYGQPASVE